MSTARRDALQMVDSFHELNQQAVTLLTRVIARDELAIDGILGRLRVARDFECDRTHSSALLN